MQIKVSNLSHVFNKGDVTEFKALANASININKGDYIGVIGHSGSGKTTFIEHLNALLKPTTGSIEYVWNDKDKKGNKIVKTRTINGKTRKIKKPKELRSRIGVVFQFAEYQLFESEIIKDVMFAPINMGKTKEQAKRLSYKYLKMVGMDKSFAHKSPFSLSGGQKRRVALAGILAMEPEVLIFDEPTVGLDPQGAREVLNIFDKLNKQGKTIIIVTHDLDNVLARTKHTALFYKQNLVKFEETKKILSDEKLLLKNNLYPPMLITLINKMRKKGIKIDYLTSKEELIKNLIKLKSEVK